MLTGTVCIHLCVCVSTCYVYIVQTSFNTVTPPTASSLLEVAADLTPGDPWTGQSLAGLAEFGLGWGPVFWYWALRSSAVNSGDLDGMGEGRDPICWAASSTWEFVIGHVSMASVANPPSGLRKWGCISLYITIYMYNRITDIVLMVK